MTSILDKNVSDSDKIEIITRFILHAPPGEFREVVNDVRLLLNNDTLLKEQASRAFAQHIKDQLTPVSLQSAKLQSLITEYNELGSDRYYDPQRRQSFKYDHLNEDVSDYEPWKPDPLSEPWRAALDEVWLKYCTDHYPNGVCAVFGFSKNGQISLTACIEGHTYQPKNYCNGKWRSVWSVVFEGSGSRAELKGAIKAQVHYYEDGNVQFFSSKDIQKQITISNEKQTAEEMRRLVEEAESEYQTAVSDNYRTMSETTFKALRRALPVIQQKLDWNRLTGYSIGNELKPFKV